MKDNECINVSSIGNIIFMMGIKNVISDIGKMAYRFLTEDDQAIASFLDSNPLTYLKIPVNLQLLTIEFFPKKES